MNGIDVSISLHSVVLREPETTTFWYDLLRLLPESAGLTTLDPPLLYRFPSRHVPTESGVSGMILMVQSHCAFHWWPLTTFLHVTISSCLRFDPHRIIAVLLDRFSADHVNVRESAW